jgi:hypothetical protein
MAFGQASGPPASAKQVQELLALLHDAGHTDFRDARGPMGFTQRQAAGKFTRDEAEAFIEQLQAGADVDGEDRGDPALRSVPTPALAAELQRRGWIVIEP